MNLPLSHAVQPLLEGLARLAPVAAGLLIASVTCGLLLTIVVALALRLLPNLPAAVRSAIWLCVLIVIMMSPALPLLFAARDAHGASGGLVHADARWSYALVAVWATFSLFRLGQLALSAWQLCGLAHRAVPFVPSAGVRQVLSSSRRRAQLCTSREIDRPSVVGFFRPRIVLPPTLLAALSECELQQIVLHEMEHLRRRDDWTNLLQKLSVALLPLHPVVAWLDRRLCLERELACDDGVLGATRARKSYAACLTNLAEQSLLRRGVSLALGALGVEDTSKPRSEVAKRVYRILSKPETAMGRMQSRIAAGALLAGVLGAAVAFAHTPKLISFAPETHEAALTMSSMGAAVAPFEAPHAHLVRASASMPATRTALAGTVMKRQAPASTMRVAARRERMLAQRRLAEATQDQHIAPLFHLAEWSDSDMPAPRLALAVQTDSQFTYAAVPVRGGWLIVQL